MSFADQITHAAGLFEQGKLAEAAEIFKRLAQQETLDASGRVIAAINLAVTYDRMGHPDHAVTTYEYGVGLATRGYAFAQEQRAEYLYKIGRADEAIAVWEHLAALECLPADQLAAVQHKLAKRGSGT